MKKNETDRRAALRELMQQEVEKGLINHAELSRVSGGWDAIIAGTDDESCKCNCATGLLSTCKAGTHDADAT